MGRMLIYYINLIVNLGNCGFHVKREQKTEQSDTINPQSKIQNPKFKISQTI